MKNSKHYLTLTGHISYVLIMILLLCYILDITYFKTNITEETYFYSLVILTVTTILNIKI